jgi:hypothetical protein
MQYNVNIGTYTIYIACQEQVISKKYYSDKARLVGVFRYLPSFNPIKLLDILYILNNLNEK